MPFGLSACRALLPRAMSTGAHLNCGTGRGMHAWLWYVCRLSPGGIVPRFCLHLGIHGNNHCCRCCQVEKLPHVCAFQRVDSVLVQLCCKGAAFLCTIRACGVGQCMVLHGTEAGCCVFCTRSVYVCCLRFACHCSTLMCCMLPVMVCAVP